MNNDKYGRKIVKQSIGNKDQYSIKDINTDETLFSLTYPIGTPENQVYNTINSMAPSDHVVDTAEQDPRNYYETFVCSDDVSPTITLPVNSKTGLSVAYTMGASKLLLDLNGMLLSSSDYIETDPTSFTLTFDTVAGDVIGIRIL